jgi:hypothetical protein
MQIKGQIDESALRLAIDYVVSRHDALRIRVIEDDFEPPTMFAAEPEWLFDRFDMKANADLDASDAMKTVVDRFRQVSCDIRHQPPVRVMLLLGATETLVGLSLHHIAVDSWSVDLVLNDLATAYVRITLGSMQPTTPSPSFLAYAEDEWCTSTSEALRAATARCVRRLIGSTAIPVIFSKGEQRPRNLMRATRRRLTGAAEHIDKTGQQLGTTRFAVALALLAITVEARTANKFPRIAMYTPNRNRPGSELLVGPLGNVILVDIDCRNEIDFVELVSRTMKSVSEGYAHDGVPFARIWSACEATGLTSGSFMPRLECRWQEPPLRAKWNDLTVQVLQQATETGHSSPVFRLTNSELIATLTPSGPDLILELMYKIDVLQPAEVDAFALAFGTALRASLNNPSCSIRSIVSHL